ncbi:hypothetical protein VVR12_03265 [Rothia sp. LK2588]|uniref:HNH endonuclease n=1 Tax=Rothia sp. LK2588 TaxID=3114369 RepID=UPI0034CEDAAC
MPTEPPARCAKPGCGRFATHNNRCDHHQRTGWHEHRRLHGTNETRKRIGITDTTWEGLKTDTMTRHQGRCHWCGHDGADQIDHIQAIGLGGARTDPDNLAPIHSEPCHREKTTQELTEMRKRKQGRGNPFFTPINKNQNLQKPQRAPEKINTNPGIRHL